MLHKDSQIFNNTVPLWVPCEWNRPSEGTAPKVTSLPPWWRPEWPSLVSHQRTHRGRRAGEYPSHARSYPGSHCAWHSLYWCTLRSSLHWWWSGSRHCTCHHSYCYFHNLQEKREKENWDMLEERIKVVKSSFSTTCDYRVSSYHDNKDCYDCEDLSCRHGNLPLYRTI